jgi:hypothetical protein
MWNASLFSLSSCLSGRAVGGPVTFLLEAQKKKLLSMESRLSR